MMPRQLMFALTAAFAVGLAVQSHAASINVGFSGANQGFAGVVNAFGTFTATGSGTVVDPVTLLPENFSFIPPVVHPVSIVGGFAKVDTSPASINPATFGVTAGEISSMSNLNLDLLNGTDVPFTLSTVNMQTNSSIVLLQNVPLSISGAISALTFEQTGASALNPLGGGVGTFSVPGTFTATVSNINAALFGGLLNYDLGQITVTYDNALNGVYSLTGPLNDASLTLNGGLFNAFNVAVAEALSVSIDFPLELDVDAFADLNSQLNVQGGYYLEQLGIIVPEPGTVLMLAMGLLLLAPACRRARKT